MSRRVTTPGARGSARRRDGREPRGDARGHVGGDSGASEPARNPRVDEPFGGICDDNAGAKIDVIGSAARELSGCEEDVVTFAGRRAGKSARGGHG